MKITRFAPSPTGNLHIGNARTALIAYLYIKHHAGKWILRIDDTDLLRSKTEYTNNIKRDLSLLQIKWNDTFHQSSRITRYKEVMQDLLNSGRVYKCYESPEELTIKRKALLKSGLPPIYDRESLKISKEKQQNLEGDGKKPHFRFKLDLQDIITWNDLLHGKITVNLKNISDPVIMREDGGFTYMLPSAIDDLDYKITDVVRGDDHITNTAVQIQMLKAMGADLIPNFLHLPLLRSNEEKISKRSGGYEVFDLLQSGIEPLALCSYLSLIGSSRSIEPCISIEELIDNFATNHFSLSSPMIDTKEITNLNHKLIQKLPFEYIKNTYIASYKKNLTENFWNMVKGNLYKINEISSWMEVCYGTICSIIESEEFAKVALNTFVEGEMNYVKWVENIKQQLPTVKNINLQLRKALTGMSKGPEMEKLLYFISKESIVARLKTD